MPGIELLLAASAVFIITHLGISSSPLRGILIRLLGENGYLGLYSLIAIGAIVWLVRVYANMPHDQFLWLPSMAANAIAKLLMIASFLLVVVGVTAKNPTSMKMDDALDQEPGGVLRITRHPVQWGIALWALSHMVANGDIQSQVFFGSFLLVALLGSVLLDRRKASTGGEKWKDFVRLTSNIPFQAILTGRVKADWAGIGWVKPLVGIVVYVAVYAVHDLFTGVALFTL